MSAKAAAIRRRRKADPLHGSQLAPSPPNPRNLCAKCGHQDLIHRDGVCLRVGCTCGGVT